MFQALYLDNPINHNVRNMINGLVKSSTTQPMIKSKTMLRQPFVDLFSDWSNNQELSMERLCLKALTLTALTLMLRPSDIASRSIILQVGNVINTQFTAD